MNDTDLPRSRPPYSELLRHPLWLRKKLQIMGLRGCVCESCGSEFEPQVHHIVLRNLKPWEYEDGHYRVWCRNCFATRRQMMDRLIERLRLGTADLTIQNFVSRVSKVEREFGGGE